MATFHMDYSAESACIMHQNPCEILLCERGLRIVDSTSHYISMESAWISAAAVCKGPNRDLHVPC